ncbi:MAG TPA: hypothetical protein VNG53_08885 [Bacteroidia bacterium]|nr:hypothetical protein [Bacteroidia bacterium]
MSNNTSQHILNTSANLLGFCLIVITSLHISNRSQTSYIDEFTSVVAVLLILSCFFSFLSIRTKSNVRLKKFETAADYLFISAITGVLLIILLLAFDILK